MGKTTMSQFPVRKKKLSVLILLLIVHFDSNSLAIANQKSPRILNQQCELELALSAAPHHLRQEATVYGLTQKGYQRIKQGSNPFTCIVNRDHPTTLKPTCFDKEGSETILPKIIFVGDQLLNKTPLDQISEQLKKSLPLMSLFLPKGLA